MKTDGKKQKDPRHQASWTLLLLLLGVLSGLFVIISIYRSVGEPPALRNAGLFELISSGWLLRSGVTRPELELIWVVQALEVLAVVILLVAVGALHAWEIRKIRQAIAPEEPERACSSRVGE